MWPVLPLKRYSDERGMEVSCLFWAALSVDPTPESELTIVKRSVYDRARPVEDHERITYANVDELQEDGWRVD